MPRTINRRTVAGMLGLGVPALAAFSYAAQTGRIPVLTPSLPSAGDLPPVPGVFYDNAPAPGVTRDAFREGVSIINLWASWCPYCRSEHEQLLKISARDEVRLFGIVMDDTEEKVAHYLKAEGNPFHHLSIDHQRHYISALRQRGLPTTLVFRENGEFVSKILGPLTDSIVTQTLLPAIEKAYSRA